MINFFSLITLILTIGGLTLGASLGKEYELLGTIVGSLSGGVIGYCIGRLPDILMNKRERQKLTGFTSEELREQLHNLNFKHTTPNYLLVELRSRGEDISSELPLVLDLMRSESMLYRSFGYGAFLSGFPELYKLSKGYNPNRSHEHCIQKVEKIKSETIS